MKDRPGPRRARVALLCWFLSLPGLCFSMLMSLAGMESLLNRSQTSAASILLASLAVPLSWIALAVLTRAWLRDRPAPIPWSIAGTLCGLPLTLFTLPASLVCAPAILLALWLLKFQFQVSRHGDPSFS